MRRLLAAALLLAPVHARAERREERVPTVHLPAPVPVVVWTPPSYASSPDRRYPVLYFLHDGQGDEAVLFRQGVVDALEKDMAAGTTPELVVVCPRGTGTWWVDGKSGGRMATFLSEDLVPFVEGRYRTRASRGGRLALGISMGGYGAFRWALARPDLFVAAGGLSPAIEPMSFPAIEAMPFFIRPSLEAVFGSDPADNVIHRNDLYQMLLDDPTLASRAPFFSVRCGTEDKYRLAEMSTFFDRFLSAFSIPHEVRLETGVHDWPYWRRVLPDFVRVLARRLAPPGGAP